MEHNIEDEPAKKKRKVQAFGKCCICLDNINRSRTAYFLPCCHYFHESCINRWLETNITCPECRIPFFIQDAEQYEIYLEYHKDQKNDLDLVRQNINTNDHSIAMRFIQDDRLFEIEEIEYDDLEKFQALITVASPTFEEMYGDLLDSDSDAGSAESDILPPSGVFANE
jgi:hypothetical protein